MWMLCRRAASVGAIGAAVLFSSLLLAAPAQAIPIFLGIDASRSSIAPPTGPAIPLSGYLRVDVGSLPPNATTVRFDLLTLLAETDDLMIRLDPAFANPGLGALNAAGNFLIPNLHLVVESATTTTPLTLTSIMGTFDPGDSCSSPFCLAVQFAIADPGQAQPTLVSVYAPEPKSLILLLAGIATATAAGRTKSRASAGLAPHPGSSSEASEASEA
jgi:hypothetical protein